MNFSFGFFVCVLSFLMISQNVAAEKSKATILYTPSSRNFVNWYPLPDSKIFKFKIRAAAFTINFASYPVNGLPRLEIGQHPKYPNSGVIWRDGKVVVKNDIDSKYYVSEKKFIGYWITWFNNIFEIGIEGEKNGFVKYNDLNEFPINYIGVQTIESENPGIWIIENN